jgi:hypothetical protein
MQVFFDIVHKNELHLDVEAHEFGSIKAACDHLADTLSDFVEAGGDLNDIRDMVIDITDRRGISLSIPIAKLVEEQDRHAA